MADVIGIDPSLAGTGIATDAESYTVVTKAGQADRLDVIYTAVHTQATTCWDETRLAVLEDLPKHAHSAGLTGMAQGVVRLALIRAECPYLLVPPASLKKYATNNGNASKSDMRMAWFQRAGADVRDDNQVDALWLRQIGLALLDDPTAIVMPKVNRGALDKLELP